MTLTDFYARFYPLYILTILILELSVNCGSNLNHHTLYFIVTFVYWLVSKNMQWICPLKRDHG